jgi:hypothetical protein
MGFCSGGFTGVTDFSGTGAGLAEADTLGEGIGFWIMAGLATPSDLGEWAGNWTDAEGAGALG